MMKNKSTWITLGLILGSVAGAASVISAQEASDIPVSAEGMLVEAAWNTDKPEDKVIEGSVSFKVDVPMSRISKHMLEPGTWGKLSDNVVDYTATKVAEDERHLTYRIEQTLNPTKFPQLKDVAASKVTLLVTIVKRAGTEADAIAIRWTLDPEAQQSWKKFDGRIFAVDLHTGKTMVMVTTSSKSGFDNIPDRVRLNLVEHYLAKTKDSIIAWVKSLE